MTTTPSPTKVPTANYQIEEHPAAVGIALTICCIGWIICVPIMTIYFIRFYRQRNNIMIDKRYAICTLVMYIIIMIDTIIERPLWLMLDVGIFDNSGPYYDAPPGKNDRLIGFEIALWFINAFYSLVYFGFSASILWKFWLLFYDINYSKESQNGEWKNLIAPQTSAPTNIARTKSSIQNQWFLTHIHNFGNFQWFTIRFWSIICVLMGVSYVIWCTAWRQVIIRF